jgi:hypothetical protein
MVRETSWSEPIDCRFIAEEYPPDDIMEENMSAALP